MKDRKKRNSNIELLRILCMLMIILHHSYYHSNIIRDSSNINYIILDTLQLLGLVSNNIFVLITGYYMINKSINKKSLTKIIFEIFFYGYTILILNLMFFKQIEYDVIWKAILVITSNQQWFITAYLLLYISIPFINILTKNLNQKQMEKLIIFGILIFSISPTITLLKQYFSYYIWFVLLYLIGAYLNLYKNKELIEKNKIFLFFSIITVLLFKFLTVHNRRFIISNINNFILFTLSVSIFITFIKKKEWYNKNVNYIASSVLGIYLVHDNFILRQIIWKTVNIGAFIEKPYFWLYEIVIILFIFFTCLLIDKVRIKFIETPVLTFVYKKWEKRKDNEKELIKIRR